MAFASTYRQYIREIRKVNPDGLRLKTLAKIAPFLSFLYQDWWHVDLQGLNRLPEEGPALIVGNAGGVLPWSGVMLLYALMSQRQHPRHLSIMADLDWIEDQRVYNFAREIGFVPWSADNLKRLLSAGQLVVVFPEGLHGWMKPFGERYRLRSFDWSKIAPAVEMNVPIFPFATVGPDESFPLGFNCDKLAKLLSLPAFPVMPTFPLLPFPSNMFSLPAKWQMRVMKAIEFSVAANREQVFETAKAQAMFLEGEVQAELNRLLRMRIKALF